jgi:hypothetical protein
MNFARILNNIAQEVIDFNPEGRFHPDVAAQFVSVPDEVNQGAALANGVWTPYVAPEVVPAEPAIARLPILSPPQFKQCFTIAEENAIVDAIDAGDRTLKTAMARLDDPRLTGVDLNLASVQGLIDYIGSKGILTEARVADVKTGKLL